MRSCMENSWHSAKHIEKRNTWYRRRITWTTVMMEVVVLPPPVMWRGWEIAGQVHEHIT